MPDTIHAAVASMQATQTTFVDLLHAFQGRADGTTSKQHLDTMAWSLTTLGDGSNMAWCSRARPWKGSAHVELAKKSLSARIQPVFLDTCAILAAAVPVLRNASVRLIVPMEHSGDLLEPYWKILDYPLRRMLSKNLHSCAMAKLLDDLAQEPAPLGVFRIGNKTMHAAHPQAALSLHLRMLAPKSPKHTRKIPQYIPTIHQLWTSEEAQLMAASILAGWKEPTP